MEGTFSVPGRRCFWRNINKFTDVGIMSALLGSAIIKIASFYFMLGIKSKNDVIAIMKGDNYVYNEGNNDE